MKKGIEIAVAIAIASCAFDVTVLQAAEVSLLCALVMKPAFTTLAGEFERTNPRFGPDRPL
jgi:hypothetical protein